MADQLSFKTSNFSESEPAQVTPQGMVWSKQQEDCHNWIRTGTGNALWIAVAGSGKTTTLRGAVDLVGGYVTVVAFNKKIADEIKGKIGARGTIEGQSVQCGTMHSFGLRAWNRTAQGCKIEGPLQNTRDNRFQTAGYFKYDRIREEMEADGIHLDYGYRFFVKKLMGLAKQYGVGNIVKNEPEIWQYLVDRFDLDDMLSSFDGEFMDGGRNNMVEKGIELATEALRRSDILSYEVIDHDDMIRMPLMGYCRMFQVNWLFVDEVQDLNATRIALCRKMLKPNGGRLIAVGDPHQAIYGFTGADSDAIHSMRSTFNCIDMPLTVSFRCPQLVVKEAQRYVSHIQAHPDAPMGEVNVITEQQLLMGTELNENDVILCRLNAPLVEIAYRLIRMGTPCYVEGRDIGQGLIELLSRWKVVNISALRDRLNEYGKRQVAKLMAQNKESQAESIADKVGTLTALIDGLPVGSTVETLKVRVTSMFQDSEGNRKKCLTLSSVHKSKGREWGRVFIFGRNKFMPSPYARQDWQKEQERNLIYVAITRSMNELVYVDI